MLIVLVHVHVKADQVAAFQTATRANRDASRQEPGIAQFDILQQHDDPTRFTLLEAYRTADAAAQHKATAHYATWRDTVAGMMAEPRTSTKYSLA
jgi:quinol monooxygenase YgiN